MDKWTIEPGAVVLILLICVLYGYRWQKVRSHIGARGATNRHLACFVAGVLVLVVALMSPVDTLADQLFAMHMVQHVLLIDFAAILLICGLSKTILRPVTRRLISIERKAGLLGTPAVAVLLYAAVLWIWHLPGPYDLALRQPFWHAAEHMQFLAVGLLFWWFLLAPIRPRHHLSEMGSIIYLGANKLLVGALGILITFHPTLLYRYYATHPSNLWNLSPITDQRVGGAIMEVEQTGVLLVAVVIVFFTMINRSEAKAQQAERLLSNK